MYKLMSVLVHHGQTSNSGHYFCFVRNSNNSWYLMDDSHVSQVSQDEVLRQKAYVLFYVRTPDTASQQQQYQGYNKLAPKLVCLNICECPRSVLTKHFLLSTECELSNTFSEIR